MSKLNNGGQFFVGIIEDRNDPLELHRVRVRVVGLHTHDKELLPTQDLPFAMIMQSPGDSGSTIVPQEGTTVIVVFNDWPECQMPIVIGKLPTIEQPPDKTVSIDTFEPTPSYVDPIVPQGRTVPTNTSEANGNQIGPVNRPNPALSAIIDGPTGAASNTSAAADIITTSSAGTAATSTTGNSTSPASVVGYAKTGLGAITTKLSSLRGIMQPTAKAVGAVGKMAGALNGVGTTFATTKNTFENLILGQGNVDSAIDKFKVMASQSGPMGNGIAAILNGKSTLKSLQKDLKYGTIANLQSSFTSVTNTKINGPEDVIGLLTNVEQMTNQLTSAFDNIDQLTTTIENEFGFFSPDVFFTTADKGSEDLLSSIGTGIEGFLTSTATSVTNSALDMVDSITGEFSGIITAGIGQAQEFQSGLGDLFGAVGASGMQASLAADPFGLNNALAVPGNVAKAINSSFSSARDALVDNVGNISVLGQKKPSEVTQTDFKDVPEGSTPPIKGAFGGPNFGGASAEQPPPSNPANDIIKYGQNAGSTGKIATEPPDYWKGDRAAAVKGIEALIAAADKYKFTNEQKAALLGIVGGECDWIPQKEPAQYSSPQRLCTIFQTTFKGDLNLATQYCNWIKDNKGTREQFFDFVYDPANNGRRVGNTQPGDGGKFYGRGFLQLTGRPNYERYAKITGKPLVEQPDLLNTDLELSAEVACLFFLSCVSKSAVPTAHPGYFYAAKAAVGVNDPIVAARKLAYYEYFYGIKAPASYGYSDQQAGNATNPYSYDGSMVGDQLGQAKQGFRDPHGKYPRRRRVGEQSSSRLARGVTEETIVSLKESYRTMGVPIAMGGSWDQPNTPFGAIYPYNHVRETESGHVQEFDDTPGYERIHTYHRAGTFQEIDANGTLVTKIVGDNYTILDRNGFIYVLGNANITCKGNINILCESDANIEVSGSAEMKVGGSMDIGVARDMNIAVEGDFSLWANGAMNLQSKLGAHIRTDENMYVSSNKEMNIQSTENMYVQSLTQLHAMASTDMRLSAVNLDVTMEKTQVSSPDIRLSGDNLDVTMSDTQLGGKTTGDFIGALKGVATYASGADKANTSAGSGGAPTVDTATSPKPDAAAPEAALVATKALVHGMIPPPPGYPLYLTLEPLHAPPLLGEEKYMYELPIDGQSELSKNYNRQMVAQQGLSNQRVMGAAMGSGGGGTVIPSPKQAEILSATTFTADYKLSEHFTLGMMFDGGFNVKHKLVNQNGLTVNEIVANLSAVCENILEKYLTVLPDGIYGLGKTWKINSGYRMGSAVSDHNKGRAVDIGLVGGSERKALHHELIQKLDKIVPYDQLILEYADSTQTWIHTGFRGDGKTTYGGGNNRGMMFTMRDHKPIGQGFILLA